MGLLTDAVAEPPVESQPALAQTTVQRAWGRVHEEPDIVDVQDAVRRRETADGLDDYSSGGRWAFALPERVSVRFRQRDQTDVTGVLYDDEGWRRTVGTDGDVSWQVEAQWDFARLVHNPDWLKVQKAILARRSRADDAVDLATRLYFDRRSLQIRYLDPRIIMTAPERAQLWIRVAALTARIDAMSGGLFRRGLVVWWGARPPDKR
ncbi:MAG: hypothetical protein ACI9OJ_003933 [Myxococcota bacterium]|jgi:hypothetical protein